MVKPPRIRKSLRISNIKNIQVTPKMTPQRGKQRSPYEAPSKNTLIKVEDQT